MIPLHVCWGLCMTLSYMYSRSHLGWHFRMLFQSSKLKARTSLFTETCQKRHSSFELWAFENVSPSGIGCTIGTCGTYMHVNICSFMHICWYGEDTFTCVCWGVLMTISYMCLTRMYSQSHLGCHFRKLKAQSSNVSFTTFQWKETFELWALSFETEFENVTPSGIGCTLRVYMSYIYACQCMFLYAYMLVCWRHLYMCMLRTPHDSFIHVPCMYVCCTFLHVNVCSFMHVCFFIRVCW